MGLKYDTMSESLHGFLLARFPRGRRVKGRFYINERINIRVQDYLVIIECNEQPTTDKLKKIFINYSAEHNSHFILLFINDSSEYNYMATSNNSKNILKLLLSITNLSPTFNFINNIFYNSSCEVNMQSETINFYSDRKPLISIKNLADVEAFNVEQDKLLSEVNKVKQDILEIVQRYDKLAHFQKYDILNMYCQGYVCKFQKNFKYWKITFYKNFNLDYIFVTTSINEIHEELMELADEHARIERFHGLFRDEYWEQIMQ